MTQDNQPGSLSVTYVTPAVIADVTERIVAAVDPQRIILFGSQARGDAAAGSDLDLLVIQDSPHSDREIRRRIEQRLLDRRFGLRIECAGGFVQQQDRCIPQQRTGDGDALPLSAGQAHAALAEFGGVPAGLGDDEVVRLRRFRRAFDIGLAGAIAAHGDVRGRIHRKDHRCCGTTAMRPRG